MSLEQRFRSIYLETGALYAELSPWLGEAALGYKILYGPPIPGADIFFLGNQPGGRSADALLGEAEGERNSWPTTCEYANRHWPLARATQAIWGAEHLRLCTGLNLCFFRSPSVDDWKAVPKALRQWVEEFSLSRAKLAVDLIRPRMIVVVGLEDFARLIRRWGGSDDVAVRTEDRVLVRSGSLWGLPCFGTIHLSGAHLSRKDREMIREYFAAA